MILNKDIINAIKAKSGLLFDKVGDFSVLSSLIFKDTGRTIGISTLKRLFNYISDDHRTSEYTLNTVSLYLGYPSWRDYLATNNIDSEWNFNDDSVYIDDMDEKTSIQVKYLDRIVVFDVILLNNHKVLAVKESVNSSLQVDDILVIHKIKKGEILQAEKVIRNGECGNYKTNGEVCSLEIIDKRKGGDF